MPLQNKPINELIEIIRGSVAGRIGPDGYYSSVAINQPRITYNHSLLTRAGVIIERGSTNVLINSRDLGAWTKNAIGLPMIITPNSATGMMGANSMTLLGRPDLEIAYLTRTFPSIAGRPASLSFTAKKGPNPEDTFASVRIQGAYTNRCEMRLNLTTGEVTTTVVGDIVNVSHTATEIRPGLWLFTLTLTSPAGVGSLLVTPIDGMKTVDSKPVVKTNAYFDTFQVEYGGPTTFIPTLAVQVSRANDDLTVIDVDGWYTKNGGTVILSGKSFGAESALCEMANRPVSSASSRVSTGANNCFTYFTQSQGQIGVPLASPLKAKVAASFKDGQQLSASVNGGNAVKSVKPIVTGDTNRVSLGRAIGGSNFLDGILESFEFIPRVVSDAELKVLSL